MPETASHGELFQQRFASPMSFTLSKPPQTPPLSPSPAQDHGEQLSLSLSSSILLSPSKNMFSNLSYIDQQLKPPIFSSSKDLDSRPEEHQGYDETLLHQSIQPLVVSDTMSHLNKPWGDKSPRTQVLEYTFLEELKSPMLLELLRRYGRSRTVCSGLTSVMMIKHIMNIEDDMIATPHLAYRVVGLKALWGQQEPVRDYSMHDDDVDTGLGEEDQHASPPVTTEPSVQLLHKSAPAFHKDIEDSLDNVNWRVTTRAVTNKTARFLNRLHLDTNGQVIGQEGLEDPFTDTPVQPYTKEIVPRQLKSNMSKLSPTSPFHSAKAN